jgi:hypothetical protein
VEIAAAPLAASPGAAVAAAPELVLVRVDRTKLLEKHPLVPVRYCAVAVPMRLRTPTAALTHARTHAWPQLLSPGVGAGPPHSSTGAALTWGAALSETRLRKRRQRADGENPLAAAAGQPPTLDVRAGEYSASCLCADGKQEAKGGDDKVDTKKPKAGSVGGVLLGPQGASDNACDGRARGAADPGAEGRDRARHPHRTHGHALRRGGAASQGVGQGAVRSTASHWLCPLHCVRTRRSEISRVGREIEELISAPTARDKAKVQKVRVRPAWRAAAAPSFTRLTAPPPPPPPHGPQFRTAGGTRVLKYCENLTWDRCRYEAA